MTIGEKRLYIWLAVMLSLLLFLELIWAHWLQPLEDRLNDSLIKIHAKTDKPDSDIVIVDIDERSLAIMADTVGRWPWPRSIHAELIEMIERQQPKAIVFDVLFSDPDLTRSSDDAYLMDVVKAFDNLYFPVLLLEDEQGSIPLATYAPLLGLVRSPDVAVGAAASMVLPLPGIVEHSLLGTHNIYADADGTVRAYRIYSDLSGWQMLSLPARVATQLDYALPDADQIRLHWHGEALSYPRISYADLYLDGQRSQRIRHADELKGKIVIIGATATGLHDVRATPVAAFYPGVEILATAIDNLKNKNALGLVPPLLICALFVMLIAILGYLFIRRVSLMQIGFLLLFLTVLSVFLAYVILRINLIATILSPVIFAWGYYFSAAAIEYLRERRTREAAIAAFGRFLDPRVVKELVDRGQTIESMAGKRSEITILFSDIRGFTTMSERSTPEEIVALLNAYFGLQSEAIFAHEGTLDKYIGDAIMAFWGAPVAQPDHAIKAVAAALDMSDRLAVFKRDHGDLARDIEIGIGVHSGPAVVGFIGSENRLDYTAIGDTVNLSSRIEGLTKGVARVLVSNETRDLCLMQAVCPFTFIAHGSYEVKGRAQPVELFEPIRK